MSFFLDRFLLDLPLLCLHARILQQNFLIPLRDLVHQSAGQRPRKIASMADADTIGVGRVPEIEKLATTLVVSSDEAL